MYRTNREQLKNCKGKISLAYKGRSIRTIPDSSMEILKTEEPGHMFYEI